MIRATIILFFFLLLSCDPEETPMERIDIDLTHIPYKPDTLQLDVPDYFPIFEQPEDNILTTEGARLGQHLFYDNILSRDSLMSCSTCHFPEGSFTDNKAFSEGVDGIEGPRSAMSLVNIGFFYRGLFWDGRINTLEEQALLPIEDPIELHTTWIEVIPKIQRIPAYQEMYREAFGITNANQITKELTAKALAQFQRTIVSSGESKYDKVQAGRAIFTPQEQMGFDIFFDTEIDLPDGQCAHCHDGPLLTTNEYLNNGLDEAAYWDDFIDTGHGGITGNQFDKGKFRVPTLRNIEFSAPYMHDGRFETLEEVMEHYVSGGEMSIGKSPFMDPDSIVLNQTHMEAVIAFMKTLSDPVMMENPNLSNPH